MSEEMQAFLQQQGIYFLRLSLAAVCGLLIGLERENRMKDAGIRTHLMVALASALMMIISKYGFFDVLQMINNPGLVKLDPSRVASGIVTGIGFIGAGTIFVRKQAVNGLTTAAGLWATVGIGMALGAGMYSIGMITTVIVLIAQVVLHKNVWLFRKSGVPLNLKVSNRPGIVADLRTQLEAKGIKVLGVKTDPVCKDILSTEWVVRLPKKMEPVVLCEELQKNSDVQGIEL